VSLASPAAAARARPLLVYVLTTVIGAAAFLYPFWIPGRALPNQAHSGDAPLVAALVGALVVATIALEVRRGTMHGATVAVLGVLSAFAGLGRLLDLPGNNAGMLFLVVLAGAAFGARFGFLLGMCTMAVSAFITGGVGPWLPFQMLALAWMGAGAGLVSPGLAGLGPRAEVAGLALYAWAWGFVYGGIMNLWFWPFQRGGELSWQPGLELGDTLDRYWSFYVATSLGWDAATALANGILVLVLGLPVLRSLRRFAHRLEPPVELVDPPRSHGFPGVAGPRAPVTP
jgi:energy-coupling factor transport system substrate-specific component